MGILKNLLNSLPPEETNSVGNPKATIDSAATPVFVGMQGGNTTPSKYEVYKSDDAEIAKKFLLSKKVSQDQYYIVVETPIGNWGIDKIGLYLERLLPWQLDLSKAECEGGLFHPQSTTGLELAARRVNDNFVTKVECGCCKHQWMDGVRYQDITIVLCPQCKKYNKVDSKNCIVLIVG
jgi:hypothetical protein